jgi:hypothetical protein
MLVSTSIGVSAFGRYQVTACMVFSSANGDGTSTLAWGDSHTELTFGIWRLVAFAFEDYRLRVANTDKPDRAMLMRQCQVRCNILVQRV